VTAGTIDRSFDPHIYHILGGREPILAGLIDTYGYPPPFEWHDGGRTGDSQFAAMVLHIVGQQISASVAFRIYDRVAAACGDIPSAAAVLTLQARRLEAAGLSRAKASYIMAFARAQADGAIDIEGMRDLQDAEVIAKLTAIHGIGLWSAQTFLIHNLARPDVLPASDLGRFMDDGQPAKPGGCQNPERRVDALPLLRFGAVVAVLGSRRRGV
jgi:DNA-3-methyladenine glycosylase II